ncbi:hypothetical protein NUW58_g5914 [Xylaria curta]|uniref:Uncharacterized protein n=1 Tax=Xylaria curta TaxID=42375 RepID=A0ACC1NZV5_9PEZI|nr:hypothetical protein NUW58_g5914 [Xylaria curta]
MQTLWSRAAQAQSSCRCRICLHSVNALTRRTATIAPKRKVTVADLFTACYTTILGTATIIDARRKNERRQELDAELSRAKASLKQALSESPASSLDGKENGVLDEGISAPNHLQAYISRRAERERRHGLEARPNTPLNEGFAEDLPGSDWEESGIPNRKRYIINHLPVWNIPSWTGNEPDRSLLEELHSLYNITYPPFARQSWIQLDWSEIEASVIAEQEDFDFILREPRTSHHMTLTAKTVQNLVDKLLRQTGLYRAYAKYPNFGERRILKELEYLRRGPDFPSYQFASADSNYTMHTRGRLDESIRRVFKESKTSREAVAKICYNLLAAGVPPTIYTYNILIIWFNRIQRPDLAQVVVDSYLDQTVWPATDQTMLCLLNHYRGLSQREHMSEVAKKLKGREDGLHLAALYGGQSNVEHLTRYQKCALERAMLFPKGQRTNATFDHLIRGWLSHEELGTACKTFVSCLRHGSSIPLYTLHELFRSCLAAADSSCARKLVMGITQNFENFQQYLIEIIGSNTVAEIGELLRSLEQIINICWFPYSEAFGRGQTHHTHAIAATSLETIISRLGVLLETDGLTHTSSLASGSLDTDRSLLSRLKLAVASLNSSKLSRRTPTTSERAYARIAMLVSIDRRCHDLEERTQNLDAALKTVIIKLRTGYNVDPTSILLADGLVDGALDKQLCMRYAFSRLDVRDESLTIEDVASQIFRQIPNEHLVRQFETHEHWKRLGIPTLVAFFGVDSLPRPVYENDPRDAGPLYRQVRELLRPVRDSIRALVFSYLSTQEQKKAMFIHGGYYRIPLPALIKSLHLDLDGRLHRVLRDPYQIEDIQPGLESEELDSHNPSILSETEDSTRRASWVLENDPIQSWRKAGEQVGDTTLSLRDQESLKQVEDKMLRMRHSESSRLQTTASF